MLSPETAKKLESLPEWKDLRQHIDDCIDAIDSCSTIPDTADYDKTARGRAEAVKILKAILEPFGYDPQPMVYNQKKALGKLGID